MAADSTREQIRALVRAALRDALPQILASGGAGGGQPASEAMAAQISAAARGEGGEIKVRMASDEDLLAFAKLFITCGDPVAQAAVLEGKVRLILESGGAASLPSTATPSNSDTKLHHGVVSERQVVEAAKTQQVLRVSKETVVTPLALERARSLGLEIVRMES